MVQVFTGRLDVIGNICFIGCYLIWVSVDLIG